MLKMKFLLVIVLAVSGCTLNSSFSNSFTEIGSIEDELLTTTTLTNYHLEVVSVGADGEKLLATESGVWLLKPSFLYEISHFNSIWRMQEYNLAPSVGDDDFTYDGVYIWAISNQVSNPSTLVQFDPVDCICIVKTYPIEGEPLSLIYEGGNVWIASINTGEDAFIHKITRYNAQDGEANLVIEFGTAFPSSLAWFKGNLWVTDSTNNLLKIFNGTTGELLKTYPTGRKPLDIAVGQEEVWIVSSEDDYITVIQSSLPESPTTFFPPCPTYPECGLNGVEISGQNAYVFSTKNERVFKIDLSNYDMTHEYEIRQPKDITVFQEQVWVLNGDRSREDRGDTITIIEPSSH